MKIIFALCLSFVVAALSMTLQNTNGTEERSLNRSKRQYLAGLSDGDAMLQVTGHWGNMINDAIQNSYKCSEVAGCYRGYCWAYCGLDLAEMDWCYTTKTYSQSFDYVPCRKDSDCNPCWKCAGSCTV